MTTAKARTAAEALLPSLEAPEVLAAEPLLLEPEDEPDEPEDEPELEEPEEPEEDPEDEEPEEVLLALAAEDEADDEAMEEEWLATRDLILLLIVAVVWQLEVEGVE